MSEIVDCPFCGESGRIERYGTVVFVGCVDLECQGGWCNKPYKTEGEAIKRWNARVPSPTTVEVSRDQ